MEKYRKYERIIIEFFNDFVENYQSENSPVQHKMVIDKEHQRYLMTLIGWENEYKFVYSIIFHLEIIDGKVWFQHNGTDILIDEELIKRGIPKKDMWIGFNPKYANEYEGYGVDEKIMV